MGGGTNAFLRYSIPCNTWYVINSNTPTFFAGAALTADTFGVIYALRGGNTPEFWLYDIISNTWQRLPDIPEPVNSGGALTFARRGDYFFVYALIGGGSTHFYHYGPYGPGAAGGPRPKGTTYNWYRLDSMHYRDPYGHRVDLHACPGASLTWIHNSNLTLDSIFCAPCDSMQQSDERKQIIAYSPADNDWHNSKYLPVTPGPGTAMTAMNSDSSQLFCLAKGPNDNKAGARMVAPVPENWDTRHYSPTPEIIQMGAATAYGEDYFYYAFFGGGSRNFWKIYYRGGCSEPGGEQSVQVTLKGNSAFFANPNPFSNKTIIRFSVLHSSHYQAKIYNAAGELVHTLLDQQLNPGTHSLTWNRCSDAKTQVPAGVYLLRLEAANGNQQSLKLVVR
ncbi:MAG: T9SS type A sorting domain-containing protein [candidate division WOR-3 bacterium]